MTTNIRQRNRAVGSQPGFWQTIGDQIPGLARGAYSGLLGLPGDVEEMTVSAAPYALLSQGKISPQRFSNLATQDYSPGLLTSEEIADPLRKEGLLSKRPLEGEYTELAGMFLSPDMFVGDIAKLGALGVGASIFTSPAQKAVREVSKEALPSQQWLKQLEGRGVKKDELEWTGLLNFLKGKKGNIQKSEVEDFIEANKIEIEEVVTGGKVEPNLDSKYAVPEVLEARSNSNGTHHDTELWLTSDESTYFSLKDQFPEIQKMEDADEDWAEYIVKEVFGEEPPSTRFGSEDLQLSGGENYRELVLKWPNSNVEKASKELQDFTSQFKDESGRSLPIPDEFKAEYERLTQAIADAKPYRGGHFPEEDNVLSHIRFNERVDTDGNKVLFIEEIQSDWAHAGLDKGFKDKAYQELEASLTKELNGYETEFQEVANKLMPNAILTRENVIPNPMYDPPPEMLLEKDRIWAFKTPTGTVAIKKNQYKATDFLSDGDEAIPSAPDITQDEALEIVLRDFQPDPNVVRADLIHQINTKSPSEFAQKFNIPTEEVNRIYGLPSSIFQVSQKLEGGAKLPPGPFVTDTHQWTNLSLKRMTKWATDNGFDSIAWTTGKQQGQRYKRISPVGSIKFSDVSARDGDVKSWKIEAWKGKDDAATLESPAGSSHKYSGGRINLSDDKEFFSEAEMRKTFGDEVADQIIADSERLGDEWGKPGVSAAILNIQEKFGDVEVGGEYGKFIYDKVLTEQAKKIGKKHGAKVEKGTVFTESGPSKTTTEEMREYIESGQDVEDLKKSLLGTGEGQEVWTLRLTDKLKEAAKEGLPYYALVPPGLLAVGAQRERQSLLE